MVSLVVMEVGLLNPEQTKEEVRRRYAAALEKAEYEALLRGTGF